MSEITISLRGTNKYIVRDLTQKVLGSIVKDRPSKRWEFRQSAVNKPNADQLTKIVNTINKLNG